MSVGQGLSGERVWGVVKTHPHKEQIAMAHLERQNFVTYCPMIQRQVRRGRHTRDVVRPLFPSYVFLHLAPEKEIWRPVLSTIGVKTLVRFGDQLGLLKDPFIESLRSREVEGVVVKPVSPYRTGQDVRIVGGAFDGIVGRILTVDAAGRLEILMDILQRSVKAKIHAEQVHLA